MATTPDLCLTPAEDLTANARSANPSNYF